MKDEKQTDLKAEDAAAKLGLEMGIELLKPALKNHKDELKRLMKKWVKGSITNKKILDRLIELKLEDNDCIIFDAKRMLRVRVEVGEPE